MVQTIFSFLGVILFIPESVLYATNEALSEFESVHESLTLLLTGEPLKIPRTQRHSPMTEDMQVRNESSVTYFYFTYTFLSHFYLL